MRPAPHKAPYSLIAGQVDLWVACPTLLASADDRGSRFCGWPSPQETARAERFRFDRDRQRYIAARLLLRGVLSEYTSVDPQAWQFALAANGKPQLAEGQYGHGLHFNLSHSGDFVAVAISRSNLGMDAEQIVTPAPVSVVRDCFTPAEQQAFASISRDDLDLAFFAQWTLKEAHLKATGEGLRVPLSTIEFQLGSREPRPIGAHGTGWTYWQRSIGPLTPGGRPTVVAVAAQPVGGENTVRAWLTRLDGTRSALPVAHLHLRGRKEAMCALA